MMKSLWQYIAASALYRWMQQFSQRQALRISRIFFALAVLITLLLQLFSFNQQLKEEHLKASLASSKQALQATERLQLQLNASGELSKLLTYQPMINQFLTDPAQQLEPQALNTMISPLFNNQARLAMIAGADAKLRYVHPDYQHYVENNSIMDVEVLQRLQAGDNSWRIVYNAPRQKASLLSTAQIGPVAAPQGILVMDYALRYFSNGLGQPGSRLFLMHKDGIGFALGQPDLHPQRLHIDSIPEEQLADTQLRFGDTQHLPSHQLHLVRWFDLELSYLDGQEDQLFIHHTHHIPEAIHDGWELLTLTPADKLLETLELNAELGAIKLILILLLCLLSDWLLRSHFKIKRLTYVDPMTRAYNRQHLQEHTPPLLARHDAGDIRHLGVLMIDIDHFKSVNDTYGHQAGDKVITAISQQIRRHCRKGDRLYRLGGEEFLLICPDLPLAMMTEVADRLRQAIAQTPEIRPAHNRTVTVSVGAAERQPQERLHNLLSRADTLLYQAKNLGRNRTESQLLPPVAAAA